VGWCQTHPSYCHLHSRLAYLLHWLMEIVIPDEWNFRRFPNQNRMQLDPAENLESDTNAFVGWAFAFDASPLSD